MFTPGPDTVRIEVTENQFVFNFRYPGPDGKFGRLDPQRSIPLWETRLDLIPPIQLAPMTLSFQR